MDINRNVNIDPQEKPETLIVVEAAHHCRCHLTVTARCRDRRHWVFLFVKSPHSIEFGDRLLAHSDVCGIFRDNSFYLDRGPNLRYHLIADRFPKDLLRRLLEDSPGLSGPEGGQLI